MTEERTTVRLTVNGTEHELEVTPDTKLADVLRGDLGLTGTKIGCGDGLCGSCVVLLDGKAVRSCTWPARRAEGKSVLTVEGLAASWGKPGELHPLQKAFIEHGAVQCGFCTPGLLMAAAALWTRLVDDGAEGEVTEDEIKKALARNACRCTGYASVLRAVQSAVHEARTGEPLPPIEIETLEPLNVIGHSPPRPDAVAKVTGAAKFADDYTFPGMLYGATLRAEHPHARILSIDTRRAEALPGVHAVLTHADVPGRNRHGLVYPDWPVLCDDKVRYLGDAVAIVAADTPETAREALKQIQVAYEPLPTVASAEQAREPGAAIVHDEWEPTAEGGGSNLLEHIKVRHGDVEKGFAQADVIIEREYHTPAYDHLFMEPECSIGVPAGYDPDHDKVTVYVGSQIPYADRAQAAAALGVPEDQVRIIGTLIGGGFGGKEDIMGQIHAALLAQATGRPVKILYDRDESLLAHPKRHATVIRIRTGAKKDGRLTAVQAELVGDAGAYASLSTKVLKRATTHATGPYDIANAKVDCYAMYTNNPPAGAFRGFGVTQSAFAVESNMDILAHELDMDPFELRRINALRVGGTTATGQVLRESVGLLDCINWVESRVKAFSESPNPELPNRATAWGLACAYKNTGFGGGAPDEANAEVEAYPDGALTGTDVQVRASSADLGQGLTTVLAQIAAEVLGLPFERVGVLLSDTDLTPDGGATTASRQTFVTGNAARGAAKELRQQLTLVVAEQWDVPPDTIRFEGGELRSGEHAALFGQAVQWLIDEGHEPRKHYLYHAPETKPLGEGGDMHFAFGFGVQAAQVAVDPQSGKVQVLRVVAAADGGRALNPLAFRGQIEGGIVMGIGTALTEEYVLEDGIPQTRRWKDYRTPLIGDMPEMHVHLAEHPISTGPYGAKGIGELPSIPTAPAICNGIYRATGMRVYSLPAKSEEIRVAGNQATGNR
jgi:CO/xanthine dehydrogenase Mo-binding subunit/aerobic-type carbon monoxide dehydrogenase small subunit (CoxS/CutS family)